MSYVVFISYSTQDMERVEEVQRALRDSQQVEVFVAEHSVRPGEHLVEKIMQAIKRCDLFVLLWSKNSEQSQWVIQELGAAAAADKPIIPIVLDKGVPLPGFAADLKYIPAYENPLTAFESLKSEILQRAKPLPDATGLVLLGILLIMLLAIYQNGSTSTA